MTTINEDAPDTAPAAVAGFGVELNGLNT
ncbi:MAG: hypothetical protein QOF36_257, partial [Microbacteriaceae bacterium]|nr:hypothetical protein [Microbacteriaceae bacterium]